MRMQKRWTINPSHPTPTEPLTIEERISRFTASQKSPAQRRRLRHAINLEQGKALKLRGAVKASRLRKLDALTLGYTITYV